MSKQKTVEVEEDILDDDINRRFTYCLAQKNEKRGRVFDENGVARPDPEFKPRQNVLLRSSIIWDGRSDPWNPDKKRPKGRHIIRYYDGCTTLFVDDQPKDRETMEQLIRSTRELFFINGYLHVYGYDVMLKAYMDMASWNAESPYKVKTVDGIFILLDSDKERDAIGSDLDLMEEALALAKKATDKHIRIHAKFLGVPTVDYKTGDQLSQKSVMTEYRKFAAANPKKFIDTYNDKKMQVKFWIEKAMEVGEISTTVIPNSASWAKKGIIICDTSGLKSNDAILNKLIEFSQIPEGEEFLLQLKALYD